jgi:hypothetical protein
MEHKAKPRNIAGTKLVLGAFSELTMALKYNG